MDQAASERSDQVYYQHQARQVFEKLKEEGIKILDREMLNEVFYLKLPEERSKDIDTSNVSAELIFKLGEHMREFEYSPEQLIDILKSSDEWKNFQ